MTVNVSQAEVAKFDAIAQQWWDPNGPSAPLHHLNPTRLRYIQGHVTLTGKNVLDVGCGAGILSASMARAGAHVTGIDASADMITVAKQHATVNKLEINYQHETIESLVSAAPPQFAVITCMEVVEHVPDPAQLIQNCYKLLQPGGTLFLSTLNRTLKAYLLAIVGAEYVCRILPQHTHDYKKFIKPAELHEMLTQAQFKLVDLAGLNYNPFLRRAKLCRDVAVNYLVCAQKNIV